METGNFQNNPITSGYVQYDPQSGLDAGHSTDCEFRGFESRSLLTQEIVPVQSTSYLCMFSNFYKMNFRFFL